MKVKFKINEFNMVKFTEEMANDISLFPDWLTTYVLEEDVIDEGTVSMMYINDHITDIDEYYYDTWLVEMPNSVIISYEEQEIKDYFKEVN